MLAQTISPLYIRAVQGYQFQTHHIQELKSCHTSLESRYPLSDMECFSFY